MHRTSIVLLLALAACGTKMAEPVDLPDLATRSEVEGAEAPAPPADPPAPAEEVAFGEDGDVTHVVATPDAASTPAPAEDPAPESEPLTDALEALGYADDAAAASGAPAMRTSGGLSGGGVVHGAGASGASYGLRGAAAKRSASSGETVIRYRKTAEMDFEADADGRYADEGGYERTSEPAPPPQPPLKAGRTDDNADFGAFEAFLATWTDRAGWEGRFDRLNVAGRAYVHVGDADGTPVADARVTLRDREGVVHTARTYGDGAAPLYPRLKGSVDPGFVVEIAHGTETRTIPWTGEADLDVRLGADLAVPEAVPLDVAIVLDTTGSMADEIDRIKATLLDVTAAVDALERPVDLRFGAVLYRDRGDAYVTDVKAFTGDVASFDRMLQRVGAGGGGDTPESLNAALDKTVHGLQWRPGAAKVAFLIADAPPHMDYDETTYGETLTEALDQGLRIHTVAASGLDALGSLVFRQVAQFTQGDFVFIQYGSMAASAGRHGVDGRQIASNDLDAILFERIRAEVEDWRR